MPATSRSRFVIDLDVPLDLSYCAIVSQEKNAPTTLRIKVDRRKPGAFQ